MTSNAAMLPLEFSPVIRNRTVSGPSPITSSEGLIRRPKSCCGIGTPYGKLHLLHENVNSVYQGFRQNVDFNQTRRDAHRGPASGPGSGDPPPHRQGAERG